MIAEQVSSFKIRWVALYIRKRAHEFPEAVRELRQDQFVPFPKEKQLVSSLDWNAIPPVSGIYWLECPQMNLYVGKALDLRQRFQLQLTSDQFDFWTAPRQEMTIRYHELPVADDTLLKGNQSFWIAQWNPVGNFSDLAAA
jgi:hypothetical protein